METNIPTAEQILEMILSSQPDKPVGREVAIEYIRGFAIRHSNEALENASRKAMVSHTWSNSEGHDMWVDRDSILSSYPETEIK